MLEQYALYLFGAGILLAVLGYVWLIVRAYRVRRAWGRAVLFFPPSSLFFVFQHRREAGGPLAVLLLGALVGAAPVGVNLYQWHFRNLGEREKIVDGELHLTLTGWDRKDYSILQAKPQTAVLQMANADVNDQVLEYLKGMDQLRELDLNDTAVTDEGLRVLAGLPRLQQLRLRKTKITDAGFREVLFAKESLLDLDLTGTSVASKTIREWKKAHPDRKVLD